MIIISLKDGAVILNEEKYSKVALENATKRLLAVTLNGTCEQYHDVVRMTLIDKDSNTKMEFEANNQ